MKIILSEKEFETEAAVTAYDAIKEAGLVKRSKTYGRIFSPTLTREEYFATTIFSHRHKPQIVGLFTALLEREEVTAEDRKVLAELLAKK